MLKKVTFSLLLIAGIAGGTYWFTYNKQQNSPVSQAINAIPDNAAVILESKQSSKTWRKLSQTNIIWEELLGTKTFQKLDKQTHFIDSLINTNIAIASLLTNNSVFISAHLSGASTFDFLYVFSLTNMNKENIVHEFIKTINIKKSTFRNYDGENISTIYPNSNDSLSYVVFEGILMMSTKQNLLELGIRHLKSGLSITQNNDFNKIIKTAGKNVDANIYINYKNLPGVLNTLLKSKYQNEIKDLANFANFSAWDISIKPNALMLSGFTQANDSANNYLNLYANQKPQDIELTDIIPAKTALLLFCGISNMKTFQNDYQKYLMKNKFSSRYKTYTDGVNKKYKIEIGNLMLDWIDNEIALVVTEPTTSANYKNNTYAVIHSNNIKAATSTLNELVKKISIKNQVKPEMVSYRNHAITHLNLPNILPVLLGWQFEKITNNYYTTIEDYIVFANSVEALQYFIFKYENNKTLGNDKNYQTFSDNMSSEANVYLYSSIARSTDIYSSYLNGSLANDMSQNLDLFNKFEAIGLQFTKSNKLYYSNGYLKYNPQHKKESGTIWESKLDTTINSKPYLVKNHNTNAKEIFIQDIANNTYLLSNTGKVLWKKQLSEKIISKVIQIDVYKNKKLQLLFNTKNAIHLLDRNGNYVSGYPILLKSPATNSLAVFDYDHNRNYRIFIADKANNILCFSGIGEQIKGFKFKKTKNSVILPIQYFIIKKKDHLCAVDNNGEIYLFNRRGKTIVELNERLAKGVRNFYVDKGKNQKQTYIIAGDTIGNIIKINLANSKENIKIQNFESSPYFEYKNINNDKTREYIFLTNKELKVFSKNKTLLFNYKFEEVVLTKPLFFLFPNGKGKIGVVSKNSNKIYLFNENGTLYKGFPYAGQTAFSIGDLNNEGIYNLVTGSIDNSIYVYQLD